MLLNKGTIYLIGGFEVVCVGHTKSGKAKMQSLGMTAGAWPGEGDISNYNDVTRKFTSDWKGIVSKFRLPKPTDKIQNQQGLRYKALVKAAINASLVGASCHFAWLTTADDNNGAWYVYDDGYVGSHGGLYHSSVVAPTFNINESKIILDWNVLDWSEIKKDA